MHNGGVSENLYYGGILEDPIEAKQYAYELFDILFGTPNHRALILNPDKNYTTIVIEKDAVVCVQHFFNLE